MYRVTDGFNRATFLVVENVLMILAQRLMVILRPCSITILSSGTAIVSYQTKEIHLIRFIRNDENNDC